ncbi:MAG: hypothetical protein D6796_11155 [Caldilineae bacterium]|nr:MAG: hypothetical protein D6796_11155 [Caldilineae bacterium]
MAGAGRAFPQSHLCRSPFLRFSAGVVRRKEKFGKVIFVTVGTTDFDMLVQAMDEIASCLSEEVVAQIGQGRYIPKHCRYFRFAPTLEPYYQQARVVVSHGGLGTIMEVLSHRKKLISVANPDRYDDHQRDLLQVMDSHHHLIWCRSVQHLQDIFANLDSYTLLPYQEPECTIAAKIEQFLQRRGAM